MEREQHQDERDHVPSERTSRVTTPHSITPDEMDDIYRFKDAAWARFAGAKFHPRLSPAVIASVRLVLDRFERELRAG